jgi:hypothetical protein
MAQISSELPPIETEVELMNFLVRRFNAVNNVLLDKDYFEPRYTLPNKVRVGDTFYFGAAIPTTDITGEGLWIYKSTGWILIA